MIAPSYTLQDGGDQLPVDTFPTRRSSDLLVPHKPVVGGKITDAARLQDPEDLFHHAPGARHMRSEEHTSELQSHVNLVCRVLLGKEKSPGWVWDWRCAREDFQLMIAASAT